MWEHRELLFYNYPIFAIVGLFRNQALGKILFFVPVAAGYKYIPSLTLFWNEAFSFQKVRRSMIISSGFGGTSVRFFWGNIPLFWLPWEQECDISEEWPWDLKALVPLGPMNASGFPPTLARAIFQQCNRQRISCCRNAETLAAEFYYFLSVGQWSVIGLG